MSIDPLAEDYPYNSTYAFQENKMGMGTELEGSEIDLFPWLAADTVKNPNGVGAHTLGIAEGLGNSARGLWNAVTNLPQTAKGLGNLFVSGFANGNVATASQMDNLLGTNSLGAMTGLANGIGNAENALINGNGIQRGNVVGEIAGAIIAAKGMGAIAEGAASVMEANQTTTVYRVFGGDAAAEGMSWTPKNPLEVTNYRDAAGLPSGGLSGRLNTAEEMVQGSIKNKNIINTRPARPLDGNKGGLPEYIIDPKNVTNKFFSKPGIKL